MKSLILAACVGSTVAVVAPQFPSSVSLAAAGTGMDVKPFSMYGELSQSNNANGYSLLQLGTVTSDFVMTEAWVSGGNLYHIYDVIVRASGTRLASFNFNSQSGGASVVNYFAFASYRHGIPIPAGSLVELEVKSSWGTFAPPLPEPPKVTLSGYLQ